MVTGMKKIFIAFIFFITASMPVSADTGTAAMPFLKIPGGARGAAMGGAFSATCDDSTAIFFNPAATVFIDRSELSLSHAMWLEDMSIENISYVQPMTSLLSFTAGASALVSGKMSANDESGSSSGSFSSMDIAAQAGLSYILTKRVYVGAQAKIFSQSVDSESVSTVGGDIGIVARGDYFRYAFSVMNLGPKIKLDEHSFDLPRTIRAGISREFFKGFRAGAEYIDYIDSGASIALGSEYAISIRQDDLQHVFLRAGYASGRDSNAGSGLSAGIGFQTSDLRVDYAFVPYGDIGNLHRFSLSLFFGSSRENMRETYEYHYRSREENRLQTENKLFKKGKDRIADIPQNAYFDEYKPKEEKKIRDFTW